MAELWTILKALNWTADAFKTRGIASGRLEAEVLLAHVLGIERIGLYTSFDRPLSPREKTNYRELVKRRFSGEPCQYITGKQEFWSLDFQVSPAVLVPRPDTEVLVEEALAFLDTQDRKGRVLDVGAGSGAIAVSLAHECPEAELYACDISVEALHVAARNGETNGVEVSWVEGTIESMSREAPFDVIVSNPPYIPSATIKGLMPEVREFEPRLALDGGEDGLVVFREILANAPSMLVPGGWLGVEVEGPRQAGEIISMLEDSPFWEQCRVRQDYSGLERVVSARRKS